MKLIGMIVILPLVALYFNGARELFFAITPAFWPAKMNGSIIRGEGEMFLSYSLYIWIGLVYVIAMNLFSYRRFGQKAA